MQGSGNEISAVGLTFGLGFVLPGKQTEIEIKLRQKKIPIRVAIKRTAPGGKQINHVCKYIGISADDWDRIVRYVHDLPDFEHIGSYFDPSIPDNDYRLLPLPIQKQIISDLLGLARLKEPEMGVAPLILMKKVAEAKRKDGFIVRKIHIHSRTIDAEGKHTDHDSYFNIDSEGGVKIL